MLRSTQFSLILIKCLVQELKTHAETIVAFMTENGRPCDDLEEMKYTLLAHAENAQNLSATAAPVAAGAEPAAPVASGGARPCQIRLRLSDGSQVSDCGKMNESMKLCTSHWLRRCKRVPLLYVRCRCS